MYSSNSASRDSAFLVYVGTYTETVSASGQKSDGIYLFRMEPDTAALTLVDVTSGDANPSFLALHPNGRFLYAAHEVGQFDGQPGGGVSAFARQPQTGQLTLLNHQSSGGGHPCHVSVDALGQHLLVANFTGGNVAVLPIDPDGKLRPATDVVSHHPSDSEAPPTKTPHAHSITLDPTNRYAIAADLGLDQLLVYRFDPAQSRLRPHSRVKVRAGAGPRHLAFHPGGRYAYLINELDATLTAYAFEATDGSLRELQTAPTLPAGDPSRKQCADVHVAPSGKFVYGSNRGHDSLVIYAIDQASGRLTYVGHESTRGQTPRNFAIDPGGNFLLVANQDSNTIVTFRIDPQTGQLSPTGPEIEVPAPVCLKIQAAPSVV